MKYSELSDAAQWVACHDYWSGASDSFKRQYSIEECYDFCEDKENDIEYNKHGQIITPFSISITWHVSDVLEACPELTELQACEVLKRVKECHDASIGINWDVISTTASLMYAEKC